MRPQTVSAVATLFFYNNTFDHNATERATTTHLRPCISQHVALCMVSRQRRISFLHHGPGLVIREL